MISSDPLTAPLLALDASAERASAALAGPEGAPRVLEAPRGERAGRVLHGLVAELLAGGPPPAAVVAVRGPGSFTGLRVALAAAQGLALAMGLPAAGVETTAALAWGTGCSGRILVLLDGGQGRLFTALHERDGRQLRSPRPVADLDPEAALAVLREERPDHAFVRGRPAVLEELRAEGALEWDGPLAGAAAELALAGLALGPAEPLYLRAPSIRPRSS